MADDERPDNLGVRGAGFWSKVTSAYDLRPDEAEVLLDACRELDLIARLEVALHDAPLTVRGSQGQQVAHPAVTELRQHRATCAALLRQLALPDDPDTAERDAASRSDKARKAAHARWSRRGA